MAEKLRVIVVGGGILGAAAAWNLARAGAQVTVLERASDPASGTTAWSYGFVGTSQDMPSHDPAAFRLHAEALPEFERFERDLGGLPVAARGALAWREDTATTEALIAEQRDAGQDVAALTRAQVAERLPRLASPPAVAAWAPRDLAVEAPLVVRRLLDAAHALGGRVRCGVAVEGVVSHGGRVTGVRLADGEMLDADAVVLANGIGAAALAAPFDLVLPLHEEPATLIRLSAEADLTPYLLHAAGIEVRPGLGGGLVVAEDAPEGGDAGLAALARATVETVGTLFAPRPRLAIRTACTAPRTMTADGTPLCGPLPGVDGFYALVAFPGVIQSPRLGRRIAEAVIAR